MDWLEGQFDDSNNHHSNNDDDNKYEANIDKDELISRTKCA